MPSTSSHPVQTDEAQQPVALSSHRVLHAAAKDRLGTMVRHARRIFDVPIAIVSLAAADRWFFEDHIGVDVCETACAGCFCSHVILGSNILVVPDAALDERFRHLGLVADDPRIRFYAGAPLIDHNGCAIGALCIKDVSPRPQGLSESERRSLADLADLVMGELEARRVSIAGGDGHRRFDAIAGSAADAIVCADGANRILSWNSAAERMFGYSADEVVGQLLNIIIPLQYRSMHEAGLRRAAAGLAAGRVGSFVTVPALRRDGSEFPIELSLSHWLEDGEHRFGAIARDITERLATQARLKRAAEYDALTGLANSTVLSAHLSAAAADERAPALILLDLDGFKDVNDNLGHAAGDEVLKAIADRLRECTQDRHLAYRLGGDEFVVVLGTGGNPVLATALANELVEAIERPLELGERSVYVGASAGVAVVTDKVWSGERLLEQADLALYKAKADGKGRVHLFTPDLWSVAQSRTSVSSGIREAWERGQFELYYQPQVRLNDGVMVGAEALIRWNHPERGVMAPAAFLSTLETSLLAVPVSEWIMRTACMQAAKWRSSVFSEFRIGVNLFAAQFRSGDLEAVVGRVLGETALSASALELEITENTILRNEVRISATLSELRDMGVGIAFDDFGTGFASLTMLKEFPVTRLKIDRSFVSGPDEGDRNRLIVEAISKLACGFELEVIAEGIETRDQAGLMTKYCSEGQGYFFGKPMTVAHFEKAFARQTPDIARRVA